MRAYELPDYYVAVYFAHLTVENHTLKDLLVGKCSDKLDDEFVSMAGDGDDGLQPATTTIGNYYKA